MARILILGGTADARALAARLAARAGFDPLLSLAGRTRDPAPQPVPTRIGGFGGAEGLAAFLQAEGIAVLVDATHPFAARISANAAKAAATTGVPLVALRRPGWSQITGDRWRRVPDVAAAVAALGEAPRRVFLTIGRQEVHAFEAAPQHAYLIRSVDPVDPPLAVQAATYLTGTGPFDLAHETALLDAHRIDVLVSKDSGGKATAAKLAAARARGLPVVMIDRPALPDVPSAADVPGVVALIAHALASDANRSAMVPSAMDRGE